MAELAPIAKQRFYDLNGEPLSGGKLYTYDGGTTTPKATYKDLAAATANTNPIILDSNGYCDIRIELGSYKFVLTDSNDSTLWTVDDIQSLANIISITGALAVANNLSDLSDVAAARANLGISPLSAQTDHAVTNGQVAADLTGHVYDGTTYSSVKMEAEIIRGTTVVANVPLAMQYVNSTWRVVVDSSLSNELHGVTFSVSQTTTVGQLRAALDSGAGNGTIKIKIHQFFV